MIKTRFDCIGILNEKCHWSLTKLRVRAGTPEDSVGASISVPIMMNSPPRNYTRSY
ncbi:hypothetical protein BC939DRAFT_468659, partial [Gamsiella multidivaricata]|uniref:uncharacterized protein n=1 Tax=Gamsiella multidivaricata TaxID=101098 RepID=UPI00221F677F